MEYRPSTSRGVFTGPHGRDTAVVEGTLSVAVGVSIEGDTVNAQTVTYGEADYSLLCNTVEALEGAIASIAKTIGEKYGEDALNQLLVTKVLGGLDELTKQRG